MRTRREFITLLGGAAAAWPVAARGQQGAMPVIACLTNTNVAPLEKRLVTLREGLKETGYIDGYNVSIEYDQKVPLATRAVELVRREVAVIYALGNVAARAATAATTKIPIIFDIGGDPVALGIAASLNKPGSNATGVTQLTTTSEAKRLELLSAMVPEATVISVIVNPKSATTDKKLDELNEAARMLDRKLHILRAATESEINAAFASFVQQRLAALQIASDNFFNGQSERFAALTAANRIPSISAFREFTEAGGLASYGPIASDAARQAGRYIGRILHGEKPADLPVVQSAKFELVINLKTAKSLALAIPTQVLARADEVIE